MRPVYSFRLSDVREIFDYLRHHAVPTFERRALAAKELTLLLPLRGDQVWAEQDDTLQRALAQLLEGEQAALTRVPGIHAARAKVLTVPQIESEGEPEAKINTTAASDRLLLIAIIADAWPLDLLEEWVELAGRELDALLSICAGYRPGPPVDSHARREEAPDPRFAFLRSHRIRSTYLFADNRQQDPLAPHLLASAAEIRRALTLRSAFVHFLADQQGKPPEEQQRGFAEFCARAPFSAQPVSGPPWAGSRLERRLDREGLWIRRTVEVVRARARRDIRRRRRSGQTPAGLRQVHAKQHGLMRATLEVNPDLPSHLQRGVFAAGAKYDAWVRVSSTNPTVAPDYLPDGRGCAVKLLGAAAPGDAVLQPPLSDGNIEELSNVVSQDFVMVSNPTFFIKDARDYAVLRSLLDARPDGVAERLSLLAAGLVFGARRPRELRNFAQALRLPRHPLNLEYHSMVPILLGPDLAAKISVRPSAATRRVLAGQSRRATLRDLLTEPQRYLRTALQRTMAEIGPTPLVLELVAHIPHEQILPVENPLIDWDRHGAQQFVLGTLTIAAQDATSEVRLDLAEKMIFTPWHAIKAHRPLGSLNRARLPVYQASAEERTRANRETAVASTAAQRETQPANGGQTRAPFTASSRSTP